MMGVFCNANICNGYVFPLFVHCHHLDYIIYYSFDFVKCFLLFIYKIQQDDIIKITNKPFTEVVHEIYPSR